jgi:erythromycin esterase-like protein/predicted phosphoribosyltransferase
MRFANRVEAGQRLGEQLTAYAGRSDVSVLALPRGGVPVAAEVARRLGAPLDVYLVRKLGVPGRPEFAMGAIAEGGVEVLNEALIASLGIPRPAVRQVAVRERLELDRRDRLYRADRPAPPLRGRTVLLIDDGLATGATMEAAVTALRRQQPARIVVAAPVGAADTCQRLRAVADEVVCVSTPEPFEAVGLWYRDFTQTTDDEVRALLAAAERPVHAAGGAPSRAVPPAELLRRRALPLHGDPGQYDPLIDGIGDARVVLLGEATHGTHEFYRERAFITRRLITEQGFAGVAVEGDWPDAHQVNRYVQAAGGDADAVEALGGFQRFPAWMWRNADVLDFVGWLRAHNEGRPEAARAGFYGLDLYSLRASVAAVLAHLDKVDPEAAGRARARYGCFDHFGSDLQSYAYATTLGAAESCEREVLGQLVELHRNRLAYASRDGGVARDDYFVAEQNARLVKNAEEYYRTMLLGRVPSWNLRDRHMADTLAAILGYLDRTRPGARLVVWAHNSHVGDARATEMGQIGELNLGQLARERFGAAAVLVGFTTHTGTVTAASAWDGPAQRKQVRPSLPGSIEHLLHETGLARCLLPLRSDPELAGLLDAPRLERAIGVIYQPETERRSHYFHARAASQFDYLVHVDETRAVEPLERTAAWVAGEPAETYPSGL